MDRSKTNAKKQYEPDFKDLNSKITSSTKGIIINSPSNPTGGVWTNQAIKKTLEISKKHDLWVFSDECYEQLSYNQKFDSIATLTTKKDKIIICDLGQLIFSYCDEILWLNFTI